MPGPTSTICLKRLLKIHIPGYKQTVTLDKDIIHDEPVLMLTCTSPNVLSSMGDVSTGIGRNDTVSPWYRVKVP